VLVRAGFNRDAVFHQDVSGLQDLFAAVHEIGEMVEPAPCAASIQGDRHVIGFEGGRQPVWAITEGASQPARAMPPRA
jgi:hypothetical protein